MGSGSHLPDHLADGPAIEEADFIFDGFTPEETSAIHAAVTNLTTEFNIRSTPSATRYFLLGNYDERPKERLRLAQDLLVEHHDNAVAILLEDLDPENDDWENFYLKFRYTLTFIDYPVLVAEDNDGGHELELGEVPLAETFVVKRDYESLSIDHDLEYEKYDAMIAKLFEVFERNGHLFTWTDLDSFKQAVRAVIEETNEMSAQTFERLRGGEWPIELPEGWTVVTDQPKEPAEYNPIDQPLIRFEHDDIHLWATIERRSPLEGRPRDVIQYIMQIGFNVDSQDDLEERQPEKPWALITNTETELETARSAARYFAHRFSEAYSDTGSADEAFELASEQIDHQDHVPRR